MTLFAILYVPTYKCESSALCQIRKGEHMKTYLRHFAAMISNSSN